MADPHLSPVSRTNWSSSATCCVSVACINEQATKNLVLKIKLSTCANGLSRLKTVVTKENCSRFEIQYNKYDNFAMKTDGTFWVFQNFLKFLFSVFIVFRWRKWNQRCTSELLFYGRKSMFRLFFSLKEELWETEWYLLTYLPKKKCSSPRKQEIFFWNVQYLKDCGDLQTFLI